MINIDRTAAAVIIRELEAALGKRVRLIVDLQGLEGDSRRYRRDIDRAWAEAKEIDTALGSILQQVHGCKRRPTFFIPICKQV